MPALTNGDMDDVFGGSSTRNNLLAPGSPSSPARRSPSRQNMRAQRSNASLHAASSLGQAMGDDSAANGRPTGHSLAHELAVALMPEPSAGSKLLAEEFGIEYDEGAEGIDEDAHVARAEMPGQSFADEMGDHSLGDSFASPEPNGIPAATDDDPVFASPSAGRSKQTPKRPEKDPMDVLTENVASTDKFLSHLRRLDVDQGSSIAPLEKAASDVIRRINDTARDRESQVRELFQYEREFRKMSGEIGGTDVLGLLDELASTEELLDSTPAPSAPPADRRSLGHIEEEASAHDWEVDPDRHTLGDEDDDDADSVASSPIKSSFPPPPPLTGQPTPAQTIVHLAHLRTFTTSLVSSLSTISEQAQVNGAATTEAGRKIRALKNKIGGWRTDWDSAERSRVRIERWEAGLAEGDSDGVRGPGVKRADGRALVQEHLKAFELALAEAGTKTQAIMASS